MKSEKTNMDYLRDCIEGNDEAIEFWDAVKDEIEEKDLLIIDLRDEVDTLEGKVDDLEIEVTEYEEQMLGGGLQTLDLGIGIIEFKQPDNLKLQMIMDDLKDNPEKLLSL